MYEQCFDEMRRGGQDVVVQLRRGVQYDWAEHQ